MTSAIGLASSCVVGLLNIFVVTVSNCVRQAAGTFNLFRITRRTVSVYEIKSLTDNFSMFVEAE